MFFARQARALPTLAAVGLCQSRSNSARGTDDQNPFHEPEVGRITNTATKSPYFAKNCLRAMGFVLFFTSHLRNHSYTYGHGTFD
jgi:hypothetical protein